MNRENFCDDIDSDAVYLRIPCQNRLQSETDVLRFVCEKKKRLLNAIHFLTQFLFVEIECCQIPKPSYPQKFLPLTVSKVEPRIVKTLSDFLRSLVEFLPFLLERWFGKETLRVGNGLPPVF